MTCKLIVILGLVFTVFGVESVPAESKAAYKAFKKEQRKEEKKLKEEQKKEKKELRDEQKRERMERKTRVDINFATAEELQAALDIDAETAQKIIESRPYRSRQELNEVSGLDNREFARLQSRVVIRKCTINFARLEELQRLPGINKDTAQAIIDGRPYETKEDLLAVSGIDEETLEQLDGFIQIRMNINATPPEELEKLPGVSSAIAREIAGNVPYKIIDGSPYDGLSELVLIDGIDESVLTELQKFLEIRVNINAAESKELQTLPGVTADIADAIIAQRNACDNCLYTKTEDLLEVDDVDENLLAGIERLIDAGAGARGRKMPGQGR